MTTDGLAIAEPAGVVAVDASTIYFTTVLATDTSTSLVNTISGGLEVVFRPGGARRCAGGARLRALVFALAFGVARPGRTRAHLVRMQSSGESRGEALQSRRGSMTSAFRSVGLACLVCAATVACEPKPRIEITGRYAGPLQVPEPVALPPVIVTNRDGSLVLPPPELVWTVDPPSVAQVVGDDLVPKQNGAAALRARIAGSDQSAAVGLVVSLVDDIQLRCPDDCELEVGNERSVTAVARAEGRDAQVKPKWSSSDERVVSVDEEGRITAQAPGEAKLTAAIGRVSKSLVVDVKSPLTRVALTCEVTGERIEATLEQPQAIGEKSCALGIRSETRLVLEAYRGDTRVHEDLNERWQTTDERIASMDAGLVRGLNLGPAFVGVEVGTLSLSFPAEVLSKPPRAAGRPRAVGTCQQSALRNTPATVSYYRRTGRGGGRYGRRYTPTRRVEVTLACQDLDASACARRRVPLAGRTGGSAAVISAATACCCSVRKTQTR